MLNCFSGKRHRDSRQAEALIGNDRSDLGKPNRENINAARGQLQHLSIRLVIDQRGIFRQIKGKG